MDTTGRTVFLHVETRTIDTNVNLNATVTLQIVITKQDAKQVTIVPKSGGKLLMMNIDIELNELIDRRNRIYLTRILKILGRIIYFTVYHYSSNSMFS